MNPVVGALMIGITVTFVALLVYAVNYGHPWLLATLIVAAVAGFTPWHRLG